MKYSKELINDYVYTSPELREITIATSNWTQYADLKNQLMRKWYDIIMK